MKITRKYLLDWLHIARWQLRNGLRHEANASLLMYRMMYRGVPESTKRAWRARRNNGSNA